MLLRRARNRSERGAALVEFALIVPILALLVFGTLDIGRAYSLQHRLTNAAREGAAFAQYFPGQVSSSGLCVDPDNIGYHALGEDRGTQSGFTVSIRNVTTNTPITGPCIRSGIAPGTKVRITVSGTFHLLTPVAQRLVASPMTIRRSAEVVVQG